uniref:Uncharacterized protein n=1 Tax=uncultured gamma proteobacterium HF0010_01E20 TaxID=710977 RepID=E0XQ73_9GAMM|nr:hypothetical protein [uncultured gamma proteobacterium HF0010_01E20]
MIELTIQPRRASSPHKISANIKTKRRTTMVVCVVSWLLGQTTRRTSVRDSFSNAHMALPRSVCSATNIAAAAIAKSPITRTSNISSW